MILTTGFPKHGNHALRKAVQLLGQPTSAVIDHVRHADYVGDGKRIFIKRDPRDALVSWLRMQHIPVTAGMFLTAMRDFNGRHLVDAMSEFEGWMSDAGTLVVRYEDLIASDSCMRNIAAYLGVAYLDGAFSALPGLTATWNSTHSDYRSIWTQQVADAWAADGCDALLARWGY